MTKDLHNTGSRIRRTSLATRVVASGLLALLLVVVWAWASPAMASASAPGLAVAEFDLPLLETPAVDAAVLTELPAGAEMQLTGSASGAYVEVITAGATGWVDVNRIHAGQIETATTTDLTQITDAPNEDGRLLAVVPAGETVILTGAEVDHYLAGSYEGTGGWLPATNISQ